MIYFLERIAKHLHDQNVGDITNHCLVFPSRRAGIYFLKYYAANLDKPVWAPAIMTINEFIGTYSDLVIPDNEVLLFELYKVYRQLRNGAESFDEFYFWGDMLANDFDDIDKYLADAPALLRNVQDFKNIDYQFGDIDPEQAEVIKRFWKNFDPEKKSPEKTGFISVWSILNELYNGFRNTLRSRGLAYEGMISRDVAEKFMEADYPESKWEKVHFIGFNALNRCELAIMKKLQDEDRACFYWDYDNSYIREGKLNSAGKFMSGNLKIFRNDMPSDWKYDTLLTVSDPKVTRNIIETTSEIAQVKLIPYLIDRMPGLSPEDAHHTAVILADENLIVPMLTSLPENTGDINITMGYPLKMTGVYSLVRHLLNLQRVLAPVSGSIFFESGEALEILRHELIVNISGDGESTVIDDITEKSLFRIPADFLCRTELLKSIFRKTNTPQELSEYLKEILAKVTSGNPDDNDDSPDRAMQRKLQKEFIYSVFKSVTRLEAITFSSDVTFRTETYTRILDKILRNQSVPFTGEPLSGIQIMGFLETRALDFRNIILLSVNEGILPTTSQGSSFIPYSIREAFGLPVINHQESLYAYHFFRLLHRAENVTFIYNSDSTGMRTGEMSRFLTQMKYEKIIRPSFLNLTFDIRTPPAIAPIVQKNGSHLKRLLSMYSDDSGKALLSPTAINTWLACRMRFYYRYVSGLKEPEVLSEEIDHAVFGQIFHRIMSTVYSDSLNRTITDKFIEDLEKDESYLLDITDKAINENYGPDLMRPLSGNDIIVRDILYNYLRRILDADRALAPFTIIELEKQFRFILPCRSGGDTIMVRTGGSIDRVDRLAGKTRIVDYKTGETTQRISSLSDLFTDDRKKDLDGWLQTLLYCEAFLSQNQSAVVRPSIYRVKELSAGEFSDMLRIREERNSEIAVEDYLTVREEFMEGLKGVVTSIFDPEEPFRMTVSTGKCGYCPYRGLCLR